MANLSLPPPSRVAVGSVLANGQRLDVLLNPEWARYLESLNTQVVTTSNAVGQPGAPGTTGAAGAGVSLSDEGGSEVQFVPIRGAQGDAGISGPALFLLAEQSSPDQLPMLPSAPNEAFVAPTLLNSWVNYDTTVYNAAGFYKDSAGIVHLRGMVKSGTVGSPIFTLPAGYRPAHEEVFACQANNTIGRIDVTPTGDVSLLVGANPFVSLDGLTFRAAGTY